MDGDVFTKIIYQLLRLVTKIKLFHILVITLKASLICLGIYHVLTVVGRLQANERNLTHRNFLLNLTAEECPKSSFRSYRQSVIRKLSQTMNSTKFSQSENDLEIEKMLMSKCPEGYVLEITGFSEEGRPLSQVCRKRDGKAGAWTCAEGWQQLLEFPYCKRRHERDLTVLILETLHLLILQVPYSGAYQTAKYLASRDRKDETVRHEDDDRLFLSKVEKMSSSSFRSLKGYHKLAIVRHPCTRLYSTWKHLTSMAEKEVKMWVEQHLDDRSITSFEAFVEDVLRPGGTVLVDEDIHLQPQTDWLFGSQDEVDVDEVLHFEGTEGTINILRNVVPTETNLQPLVNNFLDCQNIYTRSRWSKMKDVYHMDFCVFGYNDNIEGSREIPSTNLTREVLNVRYHSCQRWQMNTTVESQSHLSDDGGRVVAKSASFSENEGFTSDGCTIHTYFQKLKNKRAVYDVETEISMDVWQKAWAAAGWKTRVLSEEDALSHPDYFELREKFENLPSVNNGDYELSCFLRYVAMANIGGGWMTDFDVLPTRFPACTAELYNGSFTIYQGSIPCMVSGSPDEYTRVAHLMAEIPWEGDDRFMVGGRPHVSDMYCFGKFIEEELVNTLLVVAPAEEFFSSENFCEASNGPLVGPLPPSMSTLPWAVHFSFLSSKKLKYSSTSLSRDVMGKLDTQKKSTLMKSGFEVLKETCHFYN